MKKQSIIDFPGRPLLKEKLKVHEGVRHFPYKDPMGYLTIGVGRNLTTVGLSSDEIEYLFENDIDRAVQIVQSSIGEELFKRLSPVRQAALVNMAFNLGYKFKSFKKFIEFVKNGDFDNAAKEMLYSLWARQVGKRAKELSEDIRKG